MKPHQAALLSIVAFMAGCSVNSLEPAMTISDGQWVEVGDLDVAQSPDLYSINIYGDSVYLRKTVVAKLFRCTISSSPCTR